MPKVFLTNPPLNMAETPLQYHRPLVPLGIGYLGGMIEDKYSDGEWSRYVARRARGAGFRDYQPTGVVAAQDNMFLSFYGQYSYERLAARIAAHSDDIKGEGLYIGVSILSDGMRNARRMLMRLRRDFPRAKLIVGGPHATFFPDDFYAEPESRDGPLVDFVVQNEGELAVIGIIEGLLYSQSAIAENGRKFGIDPTQCREASGYIIIDGGQYGRAADGYGAHVLDALPPPAYFLFEDWTGRLPYEPDRRYGLESPAANINSSRGCPHKCTFCTIPMLAPGYRTLSPARILELMRFLSIEYGVESIFFREDNFMYEGGAIAGSRWNDVEDFCRELKAAIPAMRWAIEARADNLLLPSTTSGTRLDVLAAAGLSGVYVGVESGSELMLKRFVKGATLDGMSAAIRACSALNVGVVATACFGDPDLFVRQDYPNMSNDETQSAAQNAQREQILRETREFMDHHEIPLDRREEYALVGIPVSSLYKLLDRERARYPALVESADPLSRYIYPRGFRWWSNQIYDLNRRVRPYISYTYQPMA
jgi:hypothetical protein